MSEEETLFKGLQPQFSSFLWTALTRIYFIWFRGNHLLALSSLIKLIYFCPNRVKTKFMDKVAEINRELAGFNDLLDPYRINQAKQQYARKVFPILLDQLIAKLDKAGYLEQVRRIELGFER